MATLGLTDEPAIPAVSSPGSPQWAAEIPEKRRKHLRIWLLTGAAITSSTLLIGGVTRLTESGLSIVDWDPIIGAIPPITNDDWHEAFDRYQQYPEYIKVRPDMTLSEFKYIYFWEYLHRNIGRFLGMVFLIPFIVFWLKKYFNPEMMRRAVLLFVLGAAQGAMGWYMVSSGLQDRPDVSHYRLAAHLGLAVSIFACCIWFANDLAARTPMVLKAASRRKLRNWLIGIGVLVGLQITWGAFVAGLKAGLAYNTFPLMNGSLLPPSGWRLRPVLLNLVENAATVQWTHRVLATVLLLSVIALWYQVRRSEALTTFRTWSIALVLIIAVQYILGITTLLTSVQVHVAVTHQVTALAIVAVLLTFTHGVVHSTTMGPSR